MVASLVLFDRFLAFGAIFTVGHDPVDIFTLSAIFKDPFFTIVTSGRPMGLSSTFPAERVSTLANYVVRAYIVLKFDAIITASKGAPTYKFVIIGEGLVVEFGVGFKLVDLVLAHIGFLEVIHEGGVRDFEVATDLGASGRNASNVALQDFLVYVLAPTLGAELVATGELFHLSVEGLKAD
jgi:hypothetical protein